jgi:hypothetical protein
MDLKNGTKIQHKNPPNLNRPKSTKNHKIDQNRSKNRRKSPKTTSGGQKRVKNAFQNAQIWGPTIVKQTHPGGAKSFVSLVHFNLEERSS